MNIRLGQNKAAEAFRRCPRALDGAERGKGHYMKKQVQLYPSLITVSPVGFDVDVVAAVVRARVGAVAANVGVAWTLGAVAGPVAFVEPAVIAGHSALALESVVIVVSVVAASLIAPDP